MKGAAMSEGEVWQLDSESGSRLLYAAGTPEAEAWIAENGEPHDLEPLDEVLPLKGEPEETPHERP